MKLRFPKDDADKFLIIAVAVVLLFLLLMCAGCITKKEPYFIIVSEDKAYVEPKQKRDTIYRNRFEKQFQQADSTFMAKLREASKQAAKAANKQIYLK